MPTRHARPIEIAASASAIVIALGGATLSACSGDPYPDLGSGGAGTTFGGSTGAGMGGATSGGASQGGATQGGATQGGTSQGGASSGGMQSQGGSTRGGASSGGSKAGTGSSSGGSKAGTGGSGSGKGGGTGTGTSSGGSGGGGSVSFAQLKGVLDKNCALVGCHVSGQQSPNLASNNGNLATTLTSTTVQQCGGDALVKASDTANSALLSVVTGKCGALRMPRGCSTNPCLPAADVTTITRWIQDGAKTN